MFMIDKRQSPLERCSNLSTFKNLRNIKKIDIYNHSDSI